MPRVAQDAAPARRRGLRVLRLVAAVAVAVAYVAVVPAVTVAAVTEPRYCIASDPAWHAYAVVRDDGQVDECANSRVQVTRSEWLDRAAGRQNIKVCRSSDGARFYALAWDGTDAPCDVAMSQAIGVPQTTEVPSSEWAARSGSDPWTDESPTPTPTPTPEPTPTPTSTPDPTPTPTPDPPPSPTDCGEGVCDEADVVAAVDRLHEDLLVLRGRSGEVESLLRAIRDRLGVESDPSAVDRLRSIELLLTEDPDPSSATVKLADETLASMGQPIEAGTRATERLHAAGWFIAGVLMILLVAPPIARVVLP